MGVGQQRFLAAEAVDHKPRHHRPFPLAHHFHGADKGGIHAAAVDVTDEQHRGVGITGHGHVDDVMALEIDLGRAARAFQHHHVVLCG